MLLTLVAAFAFSAIAASAAWASGPPFVETKRDTGVGETKATLNGVVNPNGAATKYYFEYGTTSSYGSKTAEMSAGSGTTNLEESKTLTGLTPHRAYHYRIVATNSNGTTNGADEVFYTTSLALPEFKPVPTKKAFASTSGAITFDLGTSSISCSKSTDSGEISSTSTFGKVVMKFTGCAVESGACKAPVTSVGAKSGEIVTDSLKGELGNVNTKEAASGVGLLFEPEANKIIATFGKTECLPEGTWTGMLAGEVAPVGKKQLTSKLVFAVTDGSKDIGAIVVKRGEVEPNLDGWFGSMAIAATDEVTFEEALEVT